MSERLHPQSNPEMNTAEKAVAEGKQSKNWERFKDISRNDIEHLSFEEKLYELTRRGWPFTEGFPSTTHARNGGKYELRVGLGNKAVGVVNYNRHNMFEDTMWNIISWEGAEREPDPKRLIEFAVCAWKELNIPQQEK